MILGIRSSTVVGLSSGFFWQPGRIVPRVRVGIAVIWSWDCFSIYPRMILRSVQELCPGPFAEQDGIWSCKTYERLFRRLDDQQYVGTFVMQSEGYTCLRCPYGSTQTVSDTKWWFIPLLFRGMVSNHVLHFICMMVMGTIQSTTCESITEPMSEDIHTAIPALVRGTIC